MSIRAYRINKIEKEEISSFNLWHDEVLMNLLDNAGCLIELGESGLIDIPLDVLKEALTVVDIDNETKEYLKKDVEFAEQNNDDWVSYYCC